MEYPKDIMVLLYDPQKKSLHIVVKLKNETGALADVASRLAKLKVNILEGFTSAPNSGGTMTWSFFAEKNGAIVDEIKRQIDSSPFVSESKVKESKNGLIVDSMTFPLRWSRMDRVVIMSVKYLAYAYTRNREIFGTGGEFIIYTLGFDFGKTTWADLIIRLGRKTILENFSDMLSVYSSVGWGIPELVEQDFSSKNFVIRLRNNFECVNAKSAKPFSQFLRGHLCGFMTILLDEEVKCDETKCVASGNECCEFVISKK